MDQLVHSATVGALWVSGVSQSAGRIEDPRFVTGRGRYVGDIDLRGWATLRWCFHRMRTLGSCRSTRSVAASPAPGVRAVLIGGDVAADGLGGFPPLFMPEDIGLGGAGFRTLRPLLAVDEVRSIGERVACVIADSPALASDAADLVVVTYDRLPARTRCHHGDTAGRTGCARENPSMSASE